MKNTINNVSVSNEMLKNGLHSVSHLKPIDLCVSNCYGHLGITNLDKDDFPLQNRELIKSRIGLMSFFNFSS